MTERRYLTTPEPDAPSDDWGWRDEPPPPSQESGPARREGDGRPQAPVSVFEEPPEKKPVRAPGRPEGSPFAAEMDLTELDDRGRPTMTWSARARRLSTSNLTFLSRRMCYVGRYVAVLVHLIDDEPVPLFGRVFACHYEGDGLCHVDMDLLPVPSDGPVQLWIHRHSRK